MKRGKAIVSWLHSDECAIVRARDNKKRTLGVACTCGEPDELDMDELQSVVDQTSEAFV